MKSKVLTAAVLMTAVFVLGLTGCGKKAGTETETVKQTETQAQTAATEMLTEVEEITEAAPVVLEAITEAATELEEITEAAFEPATEAPQNLTSDQEKDAETDYTEPVVLYAKDDLNIRSNPSTEEENIISSFDQGEEVTVVGETPNWYIISKDNFTGYVRKDGLSAEEVEPKSPEEREQASNSGSSATDAEYNVSLYAESFPVHVAGDANLRAEPSETGDVIGTINADTNVSALGETDEWYKVQADDGTVGFVHKNLIG